MVFFFKGYCDHQDLHVLTLSFPTRRSSDLHHGEAEPIMVSAQSSNEVAISLVQMEISRELVGRRFAVEARKALTLGISEVTGGHTVRNFQLLRRGRPMQITKENFFAKYMCEIKSFCRNFRKMTRSEAHRVRK